MSDELLATLEGRVRAVAEAADLLDYPSTGPISRVRRWARLNGLRIAIVPVEDQKRYEGGGLLAMDLEWWPPE